MDLRPLDRPAGAFQQQLTADQIETVCERVFGPGTQVREATELGWGGYNTTYRVELGDGPVILRVAPEPERQTRIEWQFMRNEYLAAPYFAPIAHLLPRTIAADFTHEVIPRDYVVQAVLTGRAGPDVLPTYPPAERGPFYRELGRLTRLVHGVRGPGFGPVAGPHFATWSEALVAYFADNALDLEDRGLDAADLREVGRLATADAALLDEVTSPRLLHGDLWTINVMLTPDLTVTGVYDHDRSWWGDPAADWPIHMALAKPGAERDEFWTSYGPLDDSPPARRRALYYRARHLGALRLERHRLDRGEKLADSYDELAAVVAQLSE
ncbi:aminoglycoside phosphotransferase family protein [Amycolatopsis rhabdoformis]|uniref:Aminoglycoside phosphotransferase family protein n=1 Tax=Amycolatopsis rhabdoformis TaxID=1448059 RepID=A0ABZ1IAJ0_9PSEU|nr:aminoglycoside phosphotransferase family protein [Amycolatopsis rhabdoformis]WSE30963.1 aminoglycoside phosphotransferase family protein [Amycolatopsis rhabdoformis]